VYVTWRRTRNASYKSVWEGAGEKSSLETHFEQHYKKDIKEQGMKVWNDVLINMAMNLLYPEMQETAVILRTRKSIFCYILVIQ
jgi:hypothetical protein